MKELLILETGFRVRDMDMELKFIQNGDMKVLFSSLEYSMIKGNGPMTEKKEMENWILEMVTKNIS